jgi:hypothetical protein
MLIQPNVLAYFTGEERMMLSNMKVFSLKTAQKELSNRKEQYPGLIHRVKSKGRYIVIKSQTAEEYADSCVKRVLNRELQDIF